jgi:hypothetical protein
LLDEAERAALSAGSMFSRVCALASIAEAAVQADRSRALRLLALAEDTVAGEDVAGRGYLAAGVDVLLRIAQVAAGLDGVCAVRLLAAAEQAALAVSGPGTRTTRASALCGVARQASLVDAAWSRRLLATAEEGAALPAADEREAHDRRMALPVVATALAPTDPGAAERIARSLGGWAGGLALAMVARMIAAGDPAGARRIVASIPAADVQVTALLWLAEDAASGPERLSLLLEAERATRQVLPPDLATECLVKVAGALADSDREHAALLLAEAGNPAWDNGQPLVFGEFAVALARVDPARAEALVSSVPDPMARAVRMEDLITVLIERDMGAAARVARAIPDDEDWPYRPKAAVLAQVAAVVAVTDPDQAEALARSAPEEVHRERGLGFVAEAVAAADPGRAERLAGEIRSEYVRWQALRDVVGAMAAAHPGHAERLAMMITDPMLRTRALLTIATC